MRYEDGLHTMAFRPRYKEIRTLGILLMSANLNGVSTREGFFQAVWKLKYP